jgi:hypothetical protein
VEKRRQLSGFGWPVYAAGVVFVVGRLMYSLIYGYENNGLAPTLATTAVAVFVAVIVLWRNRRRIRRWAAEEPHDDSESL